MPAAVAEKPETKAAASPRERPDYEPRLPELKVPAWQKPPINPSLLAKFREVLALQDTEELPENLYLTVGLHMALNRMFIENEQSYNEVCDLVLQAANTPVPRVGGFVKPGSVVCLKSSNVNAIYVCRGPFERELVNVYGIWRLVHADELEVPEEGIIDSKLNRQAARGAREEATDAITVPRAPR